jgi:hypothetical protein
MCADVAEQGEEGLTVGEVVEALKAAPGGVLKVGPYLLRYVGEFPYTTTEGRKESDVLERRTADRDGRSGEQGG